MNPARSRSWWATCTPSSVFLYGGTQIHLLCSSISSTLLWVTSSRINQDQETFSLIIQYIVSNFRRLAWGIYRPGSSPQVFYLSFVKPYIFVSEMRTSSSTSRYMHWSCPLLVLFFHGHILTGPVGWRRPSGDIAIFSLQEIYPHRFCIWERSISQTVYFTPYSNPYRLDTETSACITYHSVGRLLTSLLLSH